MQRESKEQQMFYMERALALGEKGRFTAPPNPWVGCVIVQEEKIVGEGFHEAPGLPHAEVAAIRQAGAQTKGATAYVTLEPCSHHGRTAPCTEALVQAGIRKVVIPFLDPDKRVAGEGAARLKRAGIEVVLGVGEEEVKRSLEPYLHQRKTGRAFCVVKTAASLDGRTAAADATSRWITGEAARRDAHHLRALSQAIVIGAGTALKDKPQLTVRLEKMPLLKPMRVLIDSSGRVPPEGPLFDTRLAPTLVCTTEEGWLQRQKEWEKHHVEVEVFKPDCFGKVPLKAVLKRLARRGVLQALIEGGPALQTAFLQENLIDRLVIYYGNCFLGTQGKPLFLLEGIQTMDEAFRLKLRDVQCFGSDIRMTYQIQA